MKIVKLKDKDYSDLEKMLTRFNLVVDKIAFPDLVIVSQKTYDRFRQALGKRAKKEYPYLSKIKLDFIVETTLLAFGPKVLTRKEGGDNLRVGYAIVVDKNNESV